MVLDFGNRKQTVTEMDKLFYQCASKYTERDRLLFLSRNTTLPGPFEYYFFGGKKNKKERGGDEKSDCESLGLVKRW